MRAVAPRLLAWFDGHGRHDLPWQLERTPYSVWVSEIMLQQTQVATVIPYYERFMRRFPTVSALAAAPLDDVLKLWSGLGYYARARNLHRAAQAVAARFGGEVPARFDDLIELPGIGRSTAGAIAAQAADERRAILDGNVKRVLARYHAIDGWPGAPAVQRELWARAEEHTPAERVADYTQAIMDLGATLCTRIRPACARCPLRHSCQAFALGRVDDFPAPRPAKAMPTRTTHMLLLLRNGELLLEKRPPSGIWGGLWSLPELADAADARRHCRAHFGCEIAAPQALAPLAHGFTHFKLRIQPLLCRVGKPTPAARQAGQLWLNLEEAHGAAIPVPVRRLIERLLAG